jgi:hypothetical protein
LKPDVSLESVTKSATPLEYYPHDRAKLMGGSLQKIYRWSAKT